MKFSLLITAAPADSYGADTAWQFAEAVLRQGHTLHRVFFYGDGVYHGNRLAAPPQDENDMAARWAHLAEQHDIDLVLCIASATRRGLLDPDEAARLGKTGDSVQAGFHLSGLGQWVDAQLTSDRVVHFGSSRG